MRRLLGSHACFLLMLALAVAALRLLIFDFAECFERRAIPSHDLYQGAGLFCPSMHSMRTSGDLAWWNPAGQFGGYAQCYNAFFSPLAPTNGHLVTILWAQMIGALSLVGIAIPEYFQYLIVNLIVLPCLTYLALAYLASLLFRSRVTVALVVIVYAFSGLGLWNSAWFYYQESATVFFLLGTAVAVCRRPTWARGAALASAVLVQVASANYWTLYNSWFVLAFLGAYAFVHGNQLKRLAVRAVAGWRDRPRLAAGMAAACTVAGAMWLATLGSVLWEQSGKYVRYSAMMEGGSPYSEKDAFDRVQEMRRYTLELFNPKVQRALASYKIINEMHNARYLGAVLLPLLVAFWFLPLRRRELWLSATAGLLLVICLAPPWLLKLWDSTPFMDHIHHLFYFYSHHLQLFVVLLAATVLDRLLSRRLGVQSSRRLNLVLTASMAACLVALAGMGISSQAFAANDPALEGVLLACVLGLIGAFACWQLAHDGNRAKQAILCATLLTIVAADLTRYYWEVSQLDQQFTVQRYGHAPTPLPLPQPVREALKQPWQLPNAATNLQEAMFANMPVASDFWPMNRYNLHRNLYELFALPPDVRNQLSHPLIAFHTSASAETPHGELFYGPGQAGFRLHWFQCGYNELAFEFDAPGDGRAVIGILDDPAWRVELDGNPLAHRRANMVGLSAAVERGRHRLRLSFQPLGRRLYWPACWLLEATLAGLAVVAVIRPARAARAVQPLEIEEERPTLRLAA